MSFIRYKKVNGKIYAYEISSHWDPKLRQSRHKSLYLGRVDEASNQIFKRIIKPKGPERLILDFGDGYFVHEFIKGDDLYSLLKLHLFDFHLELIPLMIYRLCTQSAMYNCQDWLSGNILSIFFKDTDLSSQRISELLGFLGDERIQRNFFTAYLKLVGGSDKSVIIDATNLPNQINIDFNDWGYADGRIGKQSKLLCVVDQVSKLPLFYRFLPGNVTDVNTLETTIRELDSMGVKNSFVLLDAGYFSESNIQDLYDRKIDFLTRLPAGRTIYKEIVLQKTEDIESLQYAQMSGNRGVFTKELKIKLFGKEATAYVILDSERKAKEIVDFLAKYHNDQNEDKSNDADNSKSKSKSKSKSTNANKQAKAKTKLTEEYKLALASCGIFILVSSKPIPVNEALSCYHVRQSVEQIFSFSKSDLDLLPIRHHNDNTVRGYLFLQFLLLVLFIKIRKKVGKQYTVEQALMRLRKLKCKVFDNQVIPQEITKDQKEILQLCKIIVPKSSGI